MSIRGGQIITQAGKFVLDRVQTAGPGAVSIKRDKIYELGNYNSVGTVTGIPEISYDLESFDVSTEFESILIGNPALSSSVGSNSIDFRNAIPIDVISPIKSTRGAYNITKGAVIPYLTLSKVAYSFGVGNSAKQSFTLNGDSIFYTPNTPFVEEIANAGVGPYTLASSRTADLYTDGSKSVYVLSVCLYDSTTKAYKRLYLDETGATGYTNNPTSFTLASDESATYDTIRITYSSGSATVNYTQNGVNPNGEQIHLNTTSVKPAAVRSQDIEVWIGTAGASPTFSKLNSVQTIDATWSVTLDKDEELGNNKYVAQDYDIPDVSGTVSVKPFNPADFWGKLSQITGVTLGDVVGPSASQTVPLEMRIFHPDTGARLKTIYVPDARFTVPGFKGQVQSKLDDQLAWVSDSGQMTVYNGSRV